MPKLKKLHDNVKPSFKYNQYKRNQMPNYKQKKERLRKLVEMEEQQRIKKIQQEGHGFKDTDAFKRAQKHYKYYVHRETDYSHLLDHHQLEAIDIGGKKVCKLPYPEGAYLVKDFMSVEQQMQVGYEALNQYIYRPYRTNLDGTNGLYQKQENKEISENKLVEPEQIKDENNNIQYYFNQRIRMANLGYQYDWPHRSYPSTKVSTPQTVIKLSNRAVQIFKQISKQDLDYRGEAVIVNYYKVRDYMIGHLDDGEIDQKNPIFSFCFGLSCVFLIGYPEKQKEPLAVKLEAGDLMIMSGFSRICYHGVPRIIEGSYIVPKQEELDFQLKKGDLHLKWLNQKAEVINYFKTHRLNINIRQVYPSENKQEE